MGLLYFYLYLYRHEIYRGSEWAHTRLLTLNAVILSSEKASFPRDIKKSDRTRLCGCGGVYVTGFMGFDRSPKPQAGKRKEHKKIKISPNILGTEVIPCISCTCSLSVVRSIEYLTLSTQVYNVKCKYYT
jgi:hypothetical protein